ncbi:major facilitator superfamily domain-containing protein [Lipomyces japonicus]|uniref:major facilitator superfamily domain-containing protein n=1 Tax=Lipomyces japonicus TaxID=56871 RepID=UPI0034CDE26E
MALSSDTEKVTDQASLSGTSTERVQIELDALAAELGVNQRKLLWKIDLRLVPMLCILYLLAFLDRVNISNATLFHLTTDLKLRGHEYNTALTIFFVPYILAEIPSNILMKKLRPHTWLSICMFFFGLVTCLMGLVQNYSGLLATRFFLGLCEAGMFPGCFYLIAMWYVRAEAQKRYSFFFASTTLAGAFGGLLASAIGLLEGHRGYNGWRWIFIIEGAVTAVVAVILYFLIADFPEEAKFLNPNERQFLKAKLAIDVGHSNLEHKTTWHDVKQIFKDYKIFTAGFMYFGLIVPSYGYAYFAPTILKLLKLQVIETQLHSVPPWAAAFGASMVSAILSDYFKHRYLFTLGLTGIAITGFGILLGVHDNTHTQYAALHLCALGLYSAMPIIVCWTTTNLSGHTRRAIGTGWQVGFGNIGGIIATFSFLAADAPKYTKGYAICLAFAALSMVSCLVYLLGIMKENRDRARGVGLENWESLSDEEKVLRGDNNPHFRYHY